MEYFLAALEPTGLSLREQTELIAHVNATVATFASHESRPGAPAGDEGSQHAQLMHLQQIAQDPELPRLSAAVSQMLTAQPPAMDELFQRTIDRLLVPIAQRESPDGADTLHRPVTGTKEHL